MTLKVGQRWIWVYKNHEFIAEICDVSPEYRFGAKAIVLQVIGSACEWKVNQLMDSFDFQHSDSWMYLEGQDKPVA